MVLVSVSISLTPWLPLLKTTANPKLFTPPKKNIKLRDHKVRDFVLARIFSTLSGSENYFSEIITLCFLLHWFFSYLGE